MGFEIVPFIVYCNKTDKNQLKYIIERLKTEAKKNEFPVDGLVMTYNDIDYGESLGLTSHHPKHSIAFKFYDNEYETKLIDIEYSMGKTGVLSPVAVFEPVEIDGTIVQRASLSNLSVKANALGIPYRGQTVWVSKRNLIIPYIEKAIKKDLNDITNEEAITIPLHCPICGEITEIIKNNNSEILVCTNPDCQGKLLGKLVHFCSKDAMNIDGLSESTLSRFVDLGWLNCFEDIYHLQDHKQAMYNLEGFGKRAVDKMLQAIEDSKSTTLDRFINALSIPLIGRTASKTIANYCGGKFDEFVKICENYFDFTKLDDFGDAMNRSISDYLDAHYSEMQCLAKHITFITPETTSDTLFGKTFVITGSVHIFANRNKVKAKIESLGGKVSGSVSKNTFALVNNDVDSTSSKNKKAKELGVRIITEEELIWMME